MKPTVSTPSSLYTMLHAVAGMLAAVALTAGMWANVALELQASSARQPLSPHGRRGVVIVETIGLDDPALAGPARPSLLAACNDAMAADWAGSALGCRPDCVALATR